MKGQIQRSKSFENCEGLSKVSLFPFVENSQSSNPLKSYQSCCKVQVFFKSKKFLKGQNIFKHFQDFSKVKIFQVRI